MVKLTKTQLTKITGQLGLFGKIHVKYLGDNIDETCKQYMIENAVDGVYLFKDKKEFNVDVWKDNQKIGTFSSEEIGKQHKYCNDVIFAIKKCHMSRVFDGNINDDTHWTFLLIH